MFTYFYSIKIVLGSNCEVQRCRDGVIQLANKIVDENDYIHFVEKVLPEKHYIASYEGISVVSLSLIHSH